MIKYKGSDEMSLQALWTLVTKIMDICIVWLLFYYICKNIKNNVKMILIVKGVILILAIEVISKILNLYTVGVILEYILEWGPLAIIIIFQPEIRAVLESIGRTQLLGRHKTLSVDEREKMVCEIMETVESLKKTKTGGSIYSIGKGYIGYILCL